MRSFNSFLASAILSCIAFSGFAQSAVDVGLFQNGSDLEVRVRPNSDFDGIFSALVFTVRWDASSGAELGPLVQKGASATYMPVAPSGGVHAVGSYSYQIYAGFGFERLLNTGETWEAGKEYTVLTIPVRGKGKFELINDAWTHEITSNGDYYVSLGGVDRTGNIYKSLVNAEDDGSISIVPNPNNGLFTYQFTVANATDVRIELVNTLGQTVLSDQMRDFQGIVRQEVDLTSMSNGIYYLKVNRGDRSDVQKVVYR